MTTPLLPSTNEPWKLYLVYGALVAAVAFGLATTLVPAWRGKGPAIVRTLIQRSDKLCLVLEGEDREACAEVAAVASALAKPAPLPGTSQSSAATGSGGSQP